MVNEQKKARQPKFCVVQFIELPYIRIDNYVCVPHGWVREPHVIDECPVKALVAYPYNEDPVVTRCRAKNKEKKSHHWRIYTARIVFTTDIYDDAELWIVQRNDFDPGSLGLKDSPAMIEQKNQDELNQCSSQHMKRKSEFKTPVKGPSTSDLTGHINKRMKTEISSSDKTPTHNSPSQELQQVRRIPSENHTYIGPDSIQITRLEAYPRNEESDVQFLPNPYATKPSSFDQYQRNTRQILERFARNWPNLTPVPSSRGVSSQASILEQISKHLEQENPQTNSEDLKQETYTKKLLEIANKYTQKVSEEENQITPVRDTTSRCATTYTPMASQNSTSINKRSIAARDIATTQSTTQTMDAIPKLSRSSIKRPTVARNVSSTTTAADARIVTPNFTSIDKWQRIARDIGTANTGAVAYQNIRSITEQQMAARAVAAAIIAAVNTPVASQNSTTINKRQTAAGDLVSTSTAAYTPVVSQNCTSINKGQVSVRDVATTSASNAAHPPVGSQNSASTNQRKMAASNIITTNTATQTMDTIYQKPTSINKRTGAARDIVTALYIPVANQNSKSVNERPIAARDIATKHTQTMNAISQKHTSTNKKLIAAKDVATTSTAAYAPVASQNSTSIDKTPISARDVATTSIMDIASTSTTADIPVISQNCTSIEEMQRAIRGLATTSTAAYAPVTSKRSTIMSERQMAAKDRATTGINIAADTLVASQSSTSRHEPLDGLSNHITQYAEILNKLGDNLNNLHTMYNNCYNSFREIQEMYNKF